MPPPLTGYSLLTFSASVFQCSLTLGDSLSLTFYLSIFHRKCEVLFCPFLTVIQYSESPSPILFFSSSLRLLYVFFLCSIFCSVLSFVCSLLLLSSTHPFFPFRLLLSSLPIEVTPPLRLHLFHSRHFSPPSPLSSLLSLQFLPPSLPAQPPSILYSIPRMSLHQRVVP